MPTELVTTLVLDIASNHAALIGEGVEVAGPCRGLPPGVEQRLWEFRRLPAGRVADATLANLGVMLGMAFLTGNVGRALAAAVRTAERDNITLKLGIRIDEIGLRAFPWEAIRLPSDIAAELTHSDCALALHPNVDIYRSVGQSLNSAPTPLLGPLRILVAVGSPDNLSHGSRLLDLEEELSRILDATDQGRSQGIAELRILRRGTTRAIHAALAQQPFHVLHIACHGVKTGLVLETTEGHEDLVDAARFVAEALPAGTRPPLLVLSGCSTGRVNDASVLDEDASSLSSLAEELLARGVPAALAMTGPISDAYAIRWAASFYAEVFAPSRDVSLLRALSKARRQLERERQAERAVAPAHEPPEEVAEWVTPVLVVRGMSEPLLEWDVAPENLPLAAQSKGARSPPDFVGRRRALRVAVQTLVGGVQRGFCFYGPAGIGKTRLLNELAAELMDLGCLPVKARLADSPATIVNALASALPANEDAGPSWRVRLGHLQQGFATTELVLLLDGPHDAQNAEIGDFLERFVSGPKTWRLVTTTRNRLGIPGIADDALEPLLLQPLTRSESFLLMRRLPALAALSRPEKERVFEQVFDRLGGHPGALEELSARCALGRLTLERALVETVDCVNENAALTQVLDAATTPALARKLALASAIYRMPVALAGLHFLMSEEKPYPDGLLEMWDTAVELRKMSEQMVIFDDPHGKGHSWEDSPEHVRRGYEQFRTRILEVPLEPEPGLDGAVQFLVDIGYLQLENGDEETPHYRRSRWLAHDPSYRPTDAERSELHSRAGRYFCWRADLLQEGFDERNTSLCEGRYHFYAAGKLETALAMHDDLCNRLQKAGALERAAVLAREALSWVAAGSALAAAQQFRLGAIAERGGRLHDARAAYESALSIFRAEGQQSAVAQCRDRLGSIDLGLGEFRSAFIHLTDAVRFFEEADDRPNLAKSLHQTGLALYYLDDYAASRDFFEGSLSIKTALLDHEGVARTSMHLGMLDEREGNHAAALRHYERVRLIGERVQNAELVVAAHHHLAGVLQRTEQHDRARELIRSSLDLLDTARMNAHRRQQLRASALHYLAEDSEHRGDVGGAFAYYQQAFDDAVQLEDARNTAIVLRGQANLCIKVGDYDRAASLCERSLEHAKSLASREGIGASYHLLGMIEHARHNHQAAQAHFRRAIDSATALEAPSDAAKSFARLGAVLRDVGQYDDAHESLMRAHEIEKNLGSTRNVAEILHELGVLADMTEDHVAAAEYYAECGRLARSCGHRALASSALAELAVIDVSRARWEEAARGLTLSLSLVPDFPDLSAPNAQLILDRLCILRYAIGEAQLVRHVTETVDEFTAKSILSRIPASPKTKADPSSPYVQGLLAKLKSLRDQIGSSRLSEMYPEAKELWALDVELEAKA